MKFDEIFIRFLLFLAFITLALAIVFLGYMIIRYISVGGQDVCARLILSRRLYAG